MLIPIFIISLLILGAIIYINFERLKPKWTMVGTIVGKLKWWQKGVLVGLGLGAGAAFLTKMSGGYLGLVNLPVLPLCFLIYKYLKSIIDPSSGWALIVVPLVYFISWVLVGIILAGIFHTIRRLENKFTRSR